MSARVWLLLRSGGDMVARYGALEHARARALEHARAAGEQLVCCELSQRGRVLARWAPDGCGGVVEVRP